MNKLKVNQMLNDLKSANYCCHRIIELNEELEVLNHKMLGLSHNPVEKAHRNYGNVFVNLKNT